MGHNLFTVRGLVAALKLQRSSPSTLPPADAVGDIVRMPPTAAPRGQALGYEALRDVYCILRIAGAPLEDRLEHYRQLLRRRGVEPSTIEQRMNRIRPFLGALLGSGEEREAHAPTSPTSPGYGIRFQNGEVRRFPGMPLPNCHADELRQGGAALVWVHADGATSPIDVIVQEYDDGDDLGGEGHS